MVVTSSQPSLPPAHCFYLWGYVVPQSSGSAGDYAVALFSRGKWIGNPGWVRVNDWCEPKEYAEYYGQKTRPITISAPNGRYAVVGCTCEQPDSIVAGVILPDTTIFGTPVRVASLQRRENYSPYEIDNFGCDDSGTRLSFYDYNGVDSLNVPVP